MMWHMKGLEFLVIAGFIILGIGGGWTWTVGFSRLKAKHKGSLLWKFFFATSFVFEHYVECWRVTKTPIIVEGIGIIIMVIGVLIGFLA